MKVTGTEARPTFGYLLVVEDDVHGYTGGLLIVCDRGRPLEFHCTEPVRPSRAQQILFGPTLRSYVCGEQIGGALLAKAKVPIGCLLTEDADTASAGEAGKLTTVVLSDESRGAEALRQLAEIVDPAEPFERVRQAISETQRLTATGEDRAAA
ncbi:MAG: hypothetical protein AAF266_01940 [Planctomycetota bacterium]